VIEVCNERDTGTFKRLSEIMDELLFTPLGMSDAAFWLPDGDLRASRVPTLYGARLEADGSTPVLPEPECLPTGGPPVLNGVAHCSGPRKYDAGDTGSIMPVADYAKFYEMLLTDGAQREGTTLLLRRWPWPLLLLPFSLLAALLPPLPLFLLLVRCRLL
jgi:CubicO group peptidase (beta-lactamase class C family)